MSWKGRAKASLLGEVAACAVYFNQWWDSPSWGKNKGLLVLGRGREEFLLNVVCELMIYLAIKVGKWKNTELSKRRCSCVT